MSQFALALEARVSARHISFIESGRARPGRAVVGRLVQALALSLRECNAIYVAAGYEPAFRANALRAPEMCAVARAVSLILERHEPFPAFVVNRYWDVLDANAGARRTFARIRGTGHPARNVLDDVLAPGALRAAIVNWADVAADLLRIVYHQMLRVPSDRRLRDLLQRVRQFPGVDALWRAQPPHQASSPVLEARYRCGTSELAFFSTVTAFAAPLDVTADEVRIECAFPSDATTEHFCRELARHALAAGPQASGTPR